MGPFLARIRENMDNRQEARQARQEARKERRQECHSTKHIPTDTPLADEKIPNTNRAEMQQQFLTRGADTGPTQPPKVTDSNTLKVEELREKEPVRMNELPSRLDPAHEQEVRGQPELPKIKTEKAIFDERLKKMGQKMEEKMAAFEKKFDAQTEQLNKAEATNIELNQKVAASTEASTKAQQAAATAEAGKQAALKDSTVKAADLAREQQQKNEDLECRRVAAEYETEAVRSELTSAQTTLETLRTKVTQTEGALNKSNADLTAAQTMSKASEGAVDKLQKQVDEAALQSTTAKSSAAAALLDVKNKGDEIQKLNAANKAALTEKSKAEQSLAKMEKDAKESKSQASVDLASAKKELDTAKTNNTDITTKLDLAKKEQEGNKTKLAEADTKVKKAEADLKSVNDKLSDASNEKDAAKLKAEKAESQVKELMKARDEAKTNEQSAKLETDRVRQDLKDRNKKHLEELAAESAKTKEESTKAESAAATAKSVHETLTKQLNTVQGELSEALTKLKETPPGPPKQESLSAILADVDTNTQDKNAKIERFISDVADSEIKKLLQELVDKNQENKYLQDALKFSTLSNSPKIMAQVRQILAGDLSPAEQKEYLAHLTYGPGGEDGFNSYALQSHELVAKFNLCLDLIENNPNISSEVKAEIKKISNDQLTQQSRLRLKELKELKELNDAAPAEKKPAANK